MNGYIIAIAILVIINFLLIYRIGKYYQAGYTDGYKKGADDTMKFLETFEEKRNTPENINNPENGFGQY